MKSKMQSEGNGRRSVLIILIYGLWAAMAMAVALPAAAYLLLPPKLRREKEWADAGDVTKLDVGEPVELVFRRNKLDGWRLISEKSTVWVVRKNESEFVAFAPQCTHLGCAYHWNEPSRHFICPCHTSAFSMDGRVLSGPAPRPLDQYEWKVEKGKLLVGEVQESKGASG